MAVVPRKAALAYMRVLLSLQGLYLVFLGREAFHFRDLNAGLLGVLAFLAGYSVLGLAEIVTAILLRRSRPRVMIVAIVTAALWPVPVVIGFTSSLSAIPGSLFPVFLVLLLLTIAGLLLPPVGWHGSGLSAAPEPRGLPGPGQCRGALVPWIAACVRGPGGHRGAAALRATGRLRRSPPSPASRRPEWSSWLSCFPRRPGTGLWADGIAALAFVGHGRWWPLAVLLRPSRRYGPWRRHWTRCSACRQCCVALSGFRRWPWWPGCYYPRPAPVRACPARPILRVGHA